jgi:hypothetical protein
MTASSPPSSKGVRRNLGHDLRLRLWAHEDLNLGPLPCQGIHDTPSTSTDAGLTCGDAFVVVRRLLVAALCFAGSPRDGSAPGGGPAWRGQPKTLTPSGAACSPRTNRPSGSHEPPCGPLPRPSLHPLPPDAQSLPEAQARNELGVAPPGRSPCEAAQAVAATWTDRGQLRPRLPNVQSHRP